MKYLPLITMMFCQVLFSTCKKQIKETYVEGIARDYYSKKPLENIEVYLYEVNGLEGYDHGEIQYVNTDENGYFKFQNFRAFKDHNYAIGVKNQKGYNNYLRDINTYKVIKGKKNFLVPVLLSTVSLRVIIKNTNYFDINDEFCITADFSLDSFNMGGKHPEFCLNGNIDTAYGPGEVTMNCPIIYSYRVTRNNNTFQYQYKYTPIKDSIIYFNY